MNLARPSDPDENGSLQRHRLGDSPKQRYLASELFAGFASALGGERRTEAVAAAGGPPHATRARHGSPYQPRGADQNWATMNSRLNGKSVLPAWRFG